MQRNNRELWMAFVAILIITVLYLFMVVMLDSIPRASNFFGHSLGILGFVLMLVTETLYSLRKRNRSARWGRMSEWLEFHIFTGIVGPYLVLLHSSWKFNGLAGAVMLLTVIIVISGFVGRYIYTAVPRTVDGVEIEVSQLEHQISASDAELQRWMKEHPETVLELDRGLVTVPNLPGSASALILERPFLDFSQRLRWWSAKRKMDVNTRSQAQQLEKLLKRKEVLRRQVASLVMARRLLALWHAVHIPIGMALFTAAFIHILAAIYYATLLR